MSGPCKAVVTFTVARKSTVLWRGAGGGGVQACTRRQSAAGDGVPPSLQIPPHTRILLARSPAPYSPFCQGAHPPTAFSGPMARPSLPLASSSLTHTRRMDCFCNQNADQLGSLAGLSFPAVYVGLVECAPAPPPPASSSLTHTRRMDCFCNQNADQLGSLAGPSLPSNCICRCSRKRVRLPLHILFLHTQVSR